MASDTDSDASSCSWYCWPYQTRVLYRNSDSVYCSRDHKLARDTIVRESQILQLSHDPAYCSEFLENLNQLRQDGSLTDITLNVSGFEIKCHRNVLAAASVYFKCMFSSGMRESTGSYIELKDIDPKTMKEVVEYAYTGSITVNQENVHNLIDLANQYLFVQLKKSCEEFLCNVMLPHIENCIDLFVLSNVYDLPALKEKVCELLRNKFKEVVVQAKNEELKALSEDLLIMILNDNALDIEDEDIVYQFVAKWVHADKENRISNINNIIPNVRLDFCSPRFLYQRVECDFLMSSELCQKLVHEAKSFQRHEVITPSTKPRNKFDQNRSLVITSFHNSVKDNPRKCGIIREAIDNTYAIHRLDTYTQKIEIPEVDCRVSVIHDHVVITGGRNKESNAVSDICMTFGHMKAPIVGPPLLQPRWAHATATLGDYLFIFGGSSAVNLSDKSALSTCEKIKVTKSPQGSVTLGPPELIPNMLVGVVVHGAVVFRSKIYIVGGNRYDSDGTPRLCGVMVQEYDTAIEVWSRKANLPNPCILNSGVRYKHKIYVYGVNGSGKSCFQCYTPSCDTWTVLSTPIHEHTSAPMAVWKGHIVLAGGCQVGKDLCEIEEYDPEEDVWKTWETKLCIPVPSFSELVNWKNTSLNTSKNAKAKRSTSWC